MFRLESRQKRIFEFSFESLGVRGCCVRGEEAFELFLAWGGEVSVVNVGEEIACPSL